ncbi:MAG: acetyltransferase [Bacteroidota bacterium]
MNLKRKYFKQADKLVQTYPKLNFRNHCYWRIALDNTLQDKWDTVVQRPAYANLSAAQLRQVVELLEAYEKNEPLLKEHNKNSLIFRRLKSKRSM